MPRSRRPVAARQRDDGLRGVRITALVLLIVFGVVVTVITLWPGPPDPDGQRALRAFLLEAYTRGFPRWITFGAIEFAANIVMFIPIGLFGALTLPRHRWLVVLFSFAGSAAIELFQAARLAERVGTPRDVIANGLGALIGYLLALLVVLAARRRNRRRARTSTSSTTDTKPNINTSAAAPIGTVPAET